MVNLQDLQEVTEECERLLKLAHEAPLNPYRLDADGHRWVEQYSNAWANRSNDWVRLCEVRDRLRAAVSEPGERGNG